MRRGVFLLPSLLTLGSLFCGFYAVVAVYNDDYVQASLVVLVAFLLDGVDGAVARMTGTGTDFGVQLDSLADLVSFGLAPGILVYVFALRPYGRVGWLAAFLFAACGALRLARFNIQTAMLDKRYFVGLPIPAAAAVVASFVFLMKDSSTFVLFNHEVISRQTTSVIAVILIYALSFLMVSRVRYRSLKEFDFGKRRPFTALVALLLGILVIAAQPALLLFLLFLGYAASGVVRTLPIFPRRSTLELPGPAGAGPPRV